MGLGRPWKAVLLLAVGAAGGGAALAVASVPDSTGVIHACVTTDPASGLPVTTGANVRIIDPAANQHCNTVAGVHSGAPENTVNWNVTGIQGPPGNPGTPGAPGRSVTIAGGNTFTISGGQVITVGQSPGLTLSQPPITGHKVAIVSFSGGVDLVSDLLAYTFATTQAGAGGHGSGGGAGKVQVHDIHITRPYDKSSVKLALACVNGKQIKTVTITFGKVAAGKLIKGIRYTMTDVLISSESLASVHGDPKPVENLSLNYAKIKIESHS